MVLLAVYLNYDKSIINHIYCTNLSTSSPDYFCTINTTSKNGSLVQRSKQLENQISSPALSHGDKNKTLYNSRQYVIIPGRKKRIDSIKHRQIRNQPRSSSLFLKTCFKVRLSSFCQPCHWSWESKGSPPMPPFPRNTTLLGRDS